ncbi:motility associated factor glycosyltransferase family protein [Clostridium botulinum]|uniref:Motility associated factor glycosyltransferase family protein n=1 Tax=Clostridium botulinum TaxID=1491 RepID=A0A6M0V8U8_CLOBO|nr:6-hydroxymethylpterin diphosphokinase MptE-like protein [Clostridium botulinum]NFE60762.1 motility associated factor glycosyltransferase family protein [Clostridium botulinum]NFF89246.1 motility associated factor glycosyltransferase family protein [Clostridium botulinum]NFG10766.1 motility associated factor glycosyltransferase family protein [Clostridium botulinum]
MFNKNLSALKEHYLELYQTIIDRNGEKKTEKVKSKNGMVNLMIDNEFWIHSRYNPQNEAEKWIDNINIKDEDTIITIGLGLGYYLDPLFDRYKDKKIIIVEPNIEVFKSMLSVMDITKFIKSENIVFMVGLSPYVVRKLISEYLKENKIKKVYISEMTIYRKINIDYIEELYEELDKALFQFISNIATEVAFSQMWLNNTIRLLECINEIPNIKSIEDRFSKLPVVIVSAGPSLEKNMELLKELDNKALIIAVGSAVNILEKKNISPHIIMGVDGQEMEAKIFQSLKNTKPILIFTPSIHYKAVESYSGLKMSLILNNDVPIIKFYEKLGVEVEPLDCGPSVSNIAMVFAHYIKAPQIMLIGQDLAYTNGVRYADGGIHNHKVSNDDNLKKYGYKKVKDINGEDVYTKGDLIGIKNWFEEYLKVYKDEIKVYNCTEAGVPIKGTENMKFKEAIDKFCVDEFDIYNELKKICTSINKNKNDEFTNIMLEYNEEIKELLDLSEKRLKKLYELIDNYNEEIFSEDLKELLKMCVEIEDFDVFRVFVEPTGKNYIDAITMGINNKLGELKHLNDKNRTILNGMKLQYEYIHNCFKIVKFAFEKKDVEYAS